MAELRSAAFAVFVLSAWLAAPAAAAETPRVEDLFWQARRFAYVTEPVNEWQTPMRTEKRRAGDCEDKAMWLYSHLVQNGYTRVRLVIGKFRPLDAVMHVWLVYEDAHRNTWLLDPTLQNRVWRLKNIGRGFYKPVYTYERAVI